MKETTEAAAASAVATTEENTNTESDRPPKRRPRWLNDLYAYNKRGNIEVDDDAITMALNEDRRPRRHNKKRNDRGDTSDDGGGGKDPTAGYSDRYLLDCDEERGGGSVFDVLEEGSTTSLGAATSNEGVEQDEQAVFPALDEAERAERYRGEERVGTTAVNWIQCEDAQCLKWRKVPFNTDIDHYLNGKQRFVCSEFSLSCHTLEDEDDDDEEEIETTNEEEYVAEPAAAVEEDDDDEEEIETTNATSSTGRPSRRSSKKKAINYAQYFNSSDEEVVTKKKKTTYNKKKKKTDDDESDFISMDIDDEEEEESGLGVSSSSRSGPVTRGHERIRRSGSATTRGGTASAARRSATLGRDLLVESVVIVNEDRVDEEGQAIVPAVVDGNFTRQEDNDPRYWIEKFLPSTKITNNEETRLKCSHSGCPNSACCQWKKNSHIPNDYYYCYDHFPPWNLTTESGQRSHFPDKIDIRVDLAVWNNNAGYKQNVRRYCTSDQSTQDGTTPLEVARHRRLNPGEDNIQQLGIQFTSLSVNNNKPSLTPSQWTRDGNTVGLGEFESFAGPYFRIIDEWKQKVTEFAVEVERNVSWTDAVGNNHVKKLHCMYCNYFNGTNMKELSLPLTDGGNGNIPRLKKAVPTPYWNSTTNRLELGTATMQVKVTRIPFLNQFWQICLQWAKVHKTNEGMPKFCDYQMDHRCHSGHCVNTNHIILSRLCKLSEGVNTNFVRDKCPGPPFCKCGERGVPCLIPGINHKGYRCDELSVEELERKIIALPKIFPKKGELFEGPKPHHFLNPNYAFDCIPFKPKLDENGESVIVKLYCYQCRLESRRARPELSSAQRRGLKMGTVGWYNKNPTCKICRNCGLILCDKHQNNDEVNHYDAAYIKKEQKEYKERWDEYYPT